MIEGMLWDIIDSKTTSITKYGRILYFPHFREDVMRLWISTQRKEAYSNKEEQNEAVCQVHLFRDVVKSIFDKSPLDRTP